MNARNLLIAGAVVVVTLGFVSPAAFVFSFLAALLAGLYFGMKAAMLWWKRRHYVQPAHSVSQICRVEYFRRVSAAQLESWVRAGLMARGYVFLGDPVLSRSVDGCAWKAGKRVGLFIQQERPLTERDFATCDALKRKSKVAAVLVFSPFSSAPVCDLPGLEILTGHALLSWMKILDGVRPVNLGSVKPRDCSCGAPREERVSRAGEPLLVCSRAPDCRVAPCPAPENMMAVTEEPVAPPISFVETAAVEPPNFLF